MDPELKQALVAAHCWWPVDAVSGNPIMTMFRRRARLHQHEWRERMGYPAGTQPMRPPRPKTDEPPEPAAPKQIGSRVPTEWAKAVPSMSLITPAAVQAARYRVAHPEVHQTLDEDRLWADLLSSMPMCFNLFGDLWADPNVANAAVSKWWADAPGAVSGLTFEHSPRSADPAFLGNRSAFDVAIHLDCGESEGIIGVETKYHERIEPPKKTKPTGSGQAKLDRYRQVTHESGVFKDGALAQIEGTELHQIWLDHLLVLSMLQHPSGTWTWGRFVLIHPAANTDFADTAATYQTLVVDDTTFRSMTLESILDSGALPTSTADALRDRYVFD